MFNLSLHVKEEEEEEEKESPPNVFFISSRTEDTKVTSWALIGPACGLQTAPFGKIPKSTWLHDKIRHLIKTYIRKELFRDLSSSFRPLLYPNP